MKLTRRHLRNLIHEAFNKEIVETKFVDEVVNFLVKLINKGKVKLIRALMNRHHSQIIAHEKESYPDGMPEHPDFGSMESKPPNYKDPLFVKILMPTVSIKSHRSAKSDILGHIKVSIVNRNLNTEPAIALAVFRKIIKNHLEAQYTHKEAFDQIVDEMSNTSFDVLGKKNTFVPLRKIRRLFVKAVRNLQQDQKRIVVNMAFDIVCSQLRKNKKEVIKAYLHEKIDNMGSSKHMTGFKAADMNTVASMLVELLQQHGSVLNLQFQKIVKKYEKFDIDSGRVYSPLESMSPFSRYAVTGDSEAFKSDDDKMDGGIMSSVREKLFLRLNSEGVYDKALIEDVDNFLKKVSESGN